MASVAEVKAAVDAANQLLAEAQQAGLAMIEKIDEASQQLAAALDGSGHDSVSTANAHLLQAKQQIEEGSQMLQASIEASGQYAAGL